MKKRQNKYNAKKMVVDGHTFDSQAEAEYYAYLMKAKHEGVIESFILQPVYELQPKFKKHGKLFRAITYKADFEVIQTDGKVVTIDVKGFETSDFKLKKKMFEYKYEQGLTLVCKAPKYLAPQEWVELEELKKIRKERKKQGGK